MNVSIKVLWAGAVWLVLGACGWGCTKYLEAKPDKQLVVPSTLRDLQAILDYYPRINFIAPGSGEASADNFYMTDAAWGSVSSENQPRIYTWSHDRIFDGFPNDWSRSYGVVYHANIVLEALEGVERTDGNAAEWDGVKGQALFLRAQALLQVAWLCCKAYDPSTATSDLGLPLRLDPDFNAPSVRAPVQETYDRILEDARESIRLLPAVKPVSPMRAGRAAAYALVARACLSMRDYERAGLYADSSLQLYNTLLDYNSLKPAAAYPVPPMNEEIVYELQMPVPAVLHNSRSRVDSTLYRSYDTGDLRKVIFFKANADGSQAFKGSYEGQANLFAGITTAEVYLMRAECRARQGNTAAALSDLNTVLVKRWKKGAFTPLQAADAPGALRIILEERRKELLLRGLRWMDLKRLNKEPAFAKTLVHIYKGQTFTLPPNDPRYALPLPEEVVEQTGMPQNPR